MGQDNIINSLECTSGDVINNIENVKKTIKWSNNYIDRANKIIEDVQKLIENSNKRIEIEKKR